MKVLLAHPGTQHAPRLARELATRDLLGSFHTGFALAAGGPGAACARVLSRLPGLRSLPGRILDGVPSNALHLHPTAELRALWQLRQGHAPLPVLHARNAAFQRAIPQRQLVQSDAVIGFDTSSWLLAARAQQCERPLWLDRTIAHPRTWSDWQSELHRRYPDWCPTPRPRPDWLTAAEDTEHRAATHIVVGSYFAARSLTDVGVDPAKIHVNPYGVEWSRFGASEAGVRNAVGERRPLRFLFAGTIGARKGVPLLLEAWRRLSGQRGDAELWLAGRCPPELRPLLPDLPGLRVLGQVARDRMGAVYQQCDVFVLPTLLEGFALVLLEALASGLRCLTTENSGAGEVLRHPALAECLPPGDVDALTEAMRRVLESPPDRGAVAAALQPLKARYSWTAYGERWQHLLQTSRT